MLGYHHFLEIVTFFRPPLSFSVWVGRQLMRLWVKDMRVHELYTAACGLYACWLMLRAVSIAGHWLPQGWRAIWERVHEWTILVRCRFSFCFLIHFSKLTAEIN